MAGTSLTVALTGGTGFVGRYVLRQLLDAGHYVRVLVRSAQDHDTTLPEGANATTIEGDLFDAAALTELVEGADAVVHLVGIIMERPSTGQTFKRIHIEGTRNLIKAATDTQHATQNKSVSQKPCIKKWVHMSALGTRPNAAAMYHRTKWKAEQLVRNAGLDYTIIRPSIIHGPDGEFMQMVRDFWCKFFPPFVVPYFGSGPLGLGATGRVQPVYVEDVAKLFTAALTNKQATNEVYSLGGPDEYTFAKLYSAVRNHLQKPRNKRIVAIPVWKAKLLAALPGTPFNRDQVIMSQELSTCSNAKVKNDFGIEPVAFEETLASYADQL
jgi:nucleoside-diphosphate-sugar epimerase